MSAVTGEGLAQAADPSRADRLAALGEALLTRGDFAGAEPILTEACEEFPDQSRLWGMLATALWNIGRHQAALTAIDRAYALTPKEQFATQKGWMLFEKGDFAQAETALCDAILRFPDDRSAYQILTRVYRAWRRWPEGAAAAERASIAEQTNFDVRENWAHCLLAAARPAEALTVIEDGLRLFAAPSDIFQLQKRKAQAHWQLGDTNAAIDAMEQAVAIQPGDQEALEQLTYLLLAVAGRHDQARPYHTRLRQIRAQSLPDRLCDGLAALRETTRSIKLTEPAAEWAWEIADQSAWDKSEWQSGAAWGREASKLLRRWRQTAPRDQLKQLAELTDKPDLTPLSAASLERGSYFLVGAHVGPTAPAVNMFRSATGNRPFFMLGSPIQDRAFDEILIPIQPNYISTARALIAQIKSGAAIGIMADVAGARDPLPMNFLGRDILLPLHVPKLLQRYKLPSFWCCPLWRHGRVKIELERLPDPMPDEPGLVWAHRWFAAYLGKLEAVMRGRPENLGLFAGIWANVNRPPFPSRGKAR
jgi:Flp pilus assembly protein TadD